MTYIAKPKLHHPTLPEQALGFTRRDYEGKISTLCAGCGHDSISAAHHPGLLGARHRAASRRQALRHRLLVEDARLFPRPVARLQHRARPHAVGADRREPRQPRTASTSASRGDGDSASIGLGQFAHAMRRGVNMAYIVENNGVYGLTKGQFSATADKGSKSKKGVVNSDTAIDLVALALQMGATYRRARLLGRQAAAGAADQGRDRAPRRGASRRHQSVRRIQQPRRQHQELRLRARAQRSGEPARLHRRARDEIAADYAPGEVDRGRRSTTAACCGCASSARATTPATASRR